MKKENKQKAINALEVLRALNVLASVAFITFKALKALLACCSRLTCDKTQLENYYSGIDVMAESCRGERHAIRTTFL